MHTAVLLDRQATRRREEEEEGRLEEEMGTAGGRREVVMGEDWGKLPEHSLVLSLR